MRDFHPGDRTRVARDWARGEGAEQVAGLPDRRSRVVAGDRCRGHGSPERVRGVVPQQPGSERRQLHGRVRPDAEGARARTPRERHGYLVAGRDLVGLARHQSGSVRRLQLVRQCLDPLRRPGRTQEPSGRIHLHARSRPLEPVLGHRPVRLLGDRRVRQRRPCDRLHHGRSGRRRLHLRDTPRTLR